MKILMLNGSPRPHGNTAAALEEMEKVFAAEGLLYRLRPVRGDGQVRVRRYRQ